MNFILSKLATTVLSPLGAALLLGVFALAFGVLRQRRAAWLLGALAVAWLAAWSLPPVSHALRGHLERPYPLLALNQVPAAPAIVLLGGGVEPASFGRRLPDLRHAADRVWHAARLYHAGNAPLVVLSGGSDARLYATSEAAAMQQLLLDLGVPDRALLLEERSRNTRGNAQFSAELLRQRGIGRVLLVTSALHMGRAAALFRAQGLDVVPVAADHEADDVWRWPAWRRWLPDVDALDGSRRAIKEWVGARVP